MTFAFTEMRPNEYVVGPCGPITRAGLLVAGFLSGDCLVDAVTRAVEAQPVQTEKLLRLAGIAETAGALAQAVGQREQDNAALLCQALAEARSDDLRGALDALGRLIEHVSTDDYNAERAAAAAIDLYNEAAQLRRTYAPEAANE
jgi:hypothetical protein